MHIESLVLLHYNPHYHLVWASVKIPKSWGSLQEALSALETGTYSGLGFMITPPLVMVDLDNSSSNDSIMLLLLPGSWLDLFVPPGTNSGRDANRIVLLGEMVTTLHDDISIDE